MNWSVPRIPLDDWCDAALDWLTTALSDVTRAVSHTVSDWIAALTALLQLVPPPVVILAFGLLAWRVSGWRLAIGTMLGFALLWNLRLWDPMITTLVMVVLSTAASIAIGLPLGIAAALSARTWRIVAPTMDSDSMIVWLIPAMMVGSASGN